MYFFYFPINVLLIEFTDFIVITGDDIAMTLVSYTFKWYFLMFIDFVY